MYEEHPLFIKPANENIKIWRYMDFTKLVSLLDKKALFFTRADKFSDTFEGSFPKANLPIRPLAYEGIPQEALERHFAERKADRQFMVINCWHLNEYESAAMWKLYLKSDEGIAVQSTFEKLTESFNIYSLRNVYVGMVKYIDYDSEWFSERNAFSPYLYKRKSFEHERELRAIIDHSFYVKDGIPHESKEELKDGGVYIPVDLDVLIENIHIAPTAPKWFANTVESVLNKYGLNRKVLQSSLVADPVF